MNDINENINELLNDLKQQRDELELKLKLAKLEANEEWLKQQEKQGQRAIFTNIRNNCSLTRLWD